LSDEPPNAYLSPKWDLAKILANKDDSNLSDFDERPTSIGKFFKREPTGKEKQATSSATGKFISEYNPLN
jgi:hypothetical protein